ncbi:YgiQ family radical SAM protein [[Clostridium] aminophilum]|uniref:YgiQ family radical SAM protein n=1 Tax=[Clostridium] aminophilum TaxID=1526 RepID=UPI003320D5B3
MEGFLPINRQDMLEQGIRQPDFVYVCGDAYVDHSSFGAAIISRVLEAHGYTVAMCCQPDWKDPASVAEFGEPRLGFLVSSGNMDSMVNHYTVAKKHRSYDYYSPGGVMGRRPDRAVTVYCNLIRRTFKHTPIIIGGIEASLRRMAHYDYWSDSVRRSILLESGADIISYGMGERSIVEIADALASGIGVQDITWIEGTVFKTRDDMLVEDAIRLPDYEEILRDKRKMAESVHIQYENTDPIASRRMYETYDGKTFVVQNTPAKPLSEQEMDDVYALPYTRRWHPVYDKDGGIPALSEIKFSLTSCRGCYGQCNFCALTFHEGRIVQVRSHESIIREAEQMIDDPDFKGYIHDVGGPTSEFRGPACAKQLKYGACKNRQCLFPKPCSQLIVDHSDYLKLLRKLRELPKVKKVFVRSGFRFDYLMADPNKQFLYELCKYHVSGQLRVAPEHISDNVLKEMGKPSFSVYTAFVDEFQKINQKLGKEQYVVPYLMSSHPGSTVKDAIQLAEYLHKNHLNPEQVQDYYPTPGTVSTCMYYTGINPLTMEKVYVERNPHEKAMQRALLQYRDPKNYELVKEALLQEGREDLIGFGADFLIPPRKMEYKAGKAVRPAKSGKKGPGGQKETSRPAGRKEMSRPAGRKETSRPAGHKETSRPTGQKGDVRFWEKNAPGSGTSFGRTGETQRKNSGRPDRRNAGKTDGRFGKKTSEPPIRGRR